MLLYLKWICGMSIMMRIIKNFLNRLEKALRRKEALECLKAKTSNGKNPGVTNI